MASRVPIASTARAPSSDAASIAVKSVSPMWRRVSRSRNGATASPSAVYSTEKTLPAFIFGDHGQRRTLDGRREVRVGGHTESPAHVAELAHVSADANRPNHPILCTPQRGMVTQTGLLEAVPLA